MIFSSQNSKSVYRFESLSLKPRQGSRIVHFVVLAPTRKYEILVVLVKVAHVQCVSIANCERAF